MTKKHIEAIRSEMVISTENAIFLNDLLDSLDTGLEKMGLEPTWHMDTILDIIFSDLRKHPEKFPVMLLEDSMLRYPEAFKVG